MSNQNPRRRPIYRPNVFEVSSSEQAKAVIVTPEPGGPTEHRWENETAWLADDCLRRLGIGPETA